MQSTEGRTDPFEPAHRRPLHTATPPMRSHEIRDHLRSVDLTSKPGLSPSPEPEEEGRDHVRRGEVAEAVMTW